MSCDAAAWAPMLADDDDDFQLPTMATPAAPSPPPAPPSPARPGAESPNAPLTPPALPSFSSADAFLDDLRHGPEDLFQLKRERADPDDDEARSPFGVASGSTPDLVLRAAMEAGGIPIAEDFEIGSTSTATIPVLSPPRHISGPSSQAAAASAHYNEAVAQSNNLVELGRLLLSASKEGLVEDVGRLIHRGAPFTTDWLGRSPLHFAAQAGHSAVCSKLIRAGISKDARTKVDKTPLHVAAFCGQVETMEVLLKARCDVNALDLLFMTPLHWAVARGHQNAVVMLLKYGAEVERVSKFDKTPLEIASDHNHTSIYEMLQNPAEYQVGTPEYDVNVAMPETLAATNSISALMSEEDIKVEQIMREVDGSAAVPGSAAAMRLLESKGITLQPEETAKDSALISLMQSGGQRLTLTEAGKRVLGAPVATTSRIATSRPIVVGNPAASGSRVVPKVVTLDRPSAGGVRRVVSTVQAANPVASGSKGVRRITVSPAQLAWLKEKQKQGGKIQMKEVVMGADGRRRIIVQKQAAPGTASAAGPSASAATGTIAPAAIRPAVTTIPAASLAGGATSASPLVPAGPKTQMVKIIRVDKETGKQTVSRMVVPAGSKVVSTGGLPGMQAVGAVATPAAVAGAPTIRVIPTPTKVAGGGGLSTQELETKQELAEARRALEENKRRHKKEMEDMKRQLEMLTKKLGTDKPEDGEGAAASSSVISSEDVD